MQAFLYGPLVLAGDLGDKGLTEAHICGPNLRVGAADVEQHGSPLGPVNRTPPIPAIDDSDVPSSWRRPRVVDCAGGCAAGLPHYRTEDECHLPAVESAI